MDSDIILIVVITAFVILAVGGLVGNTLSAIVWLRVQVSAKSSSAVYLAAIAINDLLHLLTYVLFPFAGFWEDGSEGLAWSFAAFAYLFTHLSSYSLEPLLVLGFSTERLFAIYRPLEVRL